MRLPASTQREARAVATLARPLLLLGERGTGKTTAAKQIHEWSGRTGRFVAVNVGAIAANLFESEMFGHRKGAFTGATVDRDGFFDLADGGTLILDELGELDHCLQSKLLSVVESGEYCPVGSTAARRSRVRLVAATNRDPSTLRPDLLDRFVWRLSLPPLRERGDALEIARAYLPEVAAELGRPVALGCRLQLTAAHERKRKRRASGPPRRCCGLAEFNRSRARGSQAVSDRPASWLSNGAAKAMARGVLYRVELTTLAPSPSRLKSADERTSAPSLFFARKLQRHERSVSLLHFTSRTESGSWATSRRWLSMMPCISRRIDVVLMPTWTTHETMPIGHLRCRC